MIGVIEQFSLVQCVRTASSALSLIFPFLQRYQKPLGVLRFENVVAKLSIVQNNGYYINFQGHIMLPCTTLLIKCYLYVYHKSHGLKDPYSIKR